MSITKEAKRVKTGSSLISFQNQIITATNQLKGIKANLLTLKTQLSADEDFTEIDAAEVDATITNLTTETQKVLG